MTALRFQTAGKHQTFPASLRGSRCEINSRDVYEAEHESREIKVYIHAFIIRLEEYLRLEILSRIAQTTAVLTRLKSVGIDKSISLSSKIRLMPSLVTSIFLYACNHGPSQQSSQEEFKPLK